MVDRIFTRQVAVLSLLAPGALRPFQPLIEGLCGADAYCKQSLQRSS
ncbi:hypothetical protein [Xanthomonas arboricola]